MRKIKKILVGVIATSCILGAGLSVSAEEVIEKDIDVNDVIIPLAIPLEASIQVPNAVRKGTSVTEARRINWGGGATGVYNAVFNDGFNDRPFNSQTNYGTTVYTTYSLSSNESSSSWPNKLTVKSSSQTATASGSFKLTR